MDARKRGYTSLGMGWQPADQALPEDGVPPRWMYMVVPTVAASKRLMSRALKRMV